MQTIQIDLKITLLGIQQVSSYMNKTSSHLIHPPQWDSFTEFDQPDIYQNDV